MPASREVEVSRPFTDEATEAQRNRAACRGAELGLESHFPSSWAARLPEMSVSDSQTSSCPEIRSEQEADVFEFQPSWHVSFVRLSLRTEHHPCRFVATFHLILVKTR